MSDRIKIDKTKVIEVGVEDIRIPQCCREGWPDCPHVVNNKQKPKKSNIGL